MIEDTKECEIYEEHERYADELNENWYDEQYEPDFDEQCELDFDEQFEPDFDEQYGCQEVNDPSDDSSLDGYGW